MGVSSVRGGLGLGTGAITLAWAAAIVVIVGGAVVAVGPEPPPSTDGGAPRSAQPSAGSKRGRNGKPDTPSPVVREASTWCSWIPPRSKPSRDPAR